MIQNNWLDRYLLANDLLKDLSRNAISGYWYFFM